MSSEVVTPETLLAGFEQAHDRARIAARGLEQMPMYFAIFETLNWAASLDDRLGKPRTGDSVQDDHLSGLLHARNRTHHQWADAFVFDTGVTAVFGHAVYDRAQYGRTHPSITWRPAAELPEPDSPRFKEPKLERAYVRALENQEVSASLDVLAEALASAVARLP